MNERTCRRIVKDRADHRCERCGINWSGWGLTTHHRVKRSQGGGWTPENCVQLCGDGVRGCHGWAESHPNDAEREGFHVRPWNDPAEIPILRRGQRVLLDGEGGFTPAEEAA